LDKFVEAMQMMAKMTDEQKMKAMNANKALCICGGCPSYNDCAKDNGESLYCSLGASSSCIKEAPVCICGGCPVTSKMGLKNQYFCTKGSEKEQRGM
jgi:hypothetical protein